MRKLEPDSLWPLTLERGRAALACGAQEPVETATERLEDEGVRFLLRIVSSLGKKDAEEAAQRAHRAPGNPFLPYDRRLFVAELTDTHVCLLNKFNVIEHHLLVVTREYESQELPLTRNDCEAFTVALTEIDGLAFYNGGRTAGASQPHRHLQLVPLPLVAGEEDLPMGPWIQRAAGGESQALPFPHAAMRISFDRLRHPARGVDCLHDCYLRLAAECGIIDRTEPAPDAVLPPYNLLITREWMLCVPRRRERWRGISLNALGYAGSLFLRSADQLEAVRRIGPMQLLIELAGPSR